MRILHLQGPSSIQGENMFGLSPLGWTLAAVSALLIGFNKTGIAGTGPIIVVLMASIFPAKESVGIVLPLLIFADIFAILFYRRHAQWKVLLRLFPFAVPGVLAGFFFMHRLESIQLKPIIGGLVLGLIVINFFLRWKKVDMGRYGLFFSGFMGMLVGFTSMIANAAGPIMTIYLLSMGAEKKEFIGNRAWFFAVINLFKLPFSLGLGLITLRSLTFDITLFPAIITGALIGVFLVKVIPQKVFNIIVEVLAAGASINLLLS